MNRPFADRYQAGRVLAEKLGSYADDPAVVVLGLPRGGVPVAFEVARALHAPLDIYLVRKLGVPGQEELAMGAIASGGVVVINHDVVEALNIPRALIQEATIKERRELDRREGLYRSDRRPIDVEGRKIILVDDGLATGSTMRAAVASLRRRGPARIVVAVPTAAPATCREFECIADACVCAITPEPFRAVGLWYEDFEQTRDEEVCELLDRAAAGWCRLAIHDTPPPPSLDPDHLPLG